MENDPRSPLNILKNKRKKQFIAKFLRKDIQAVKSEEEDELKEAHIKTSLEELEYAETKESINETVGKNPISRLIYSIRDLFWNYPKHLTKLVKTTRPVSFLILYSLFFLGLWLAFQEISVTAAGTPKVDKNRNVTYTELTVGKPAQLNPLFITNNPVDRDLQALIFNKLISVDKTGTPQAELAESWSISTNNRSYVFFLRKDVVWHDGEKFDADDVVYTFETIKKLKDANSYFSALNEVEVTKIDDYVIKCELPNVNALFMENISFPIVPEHVLKDVSTRKLEFDTFSVRPVGTGPYKLSRLTDESAILTTNKEYFRGMPHMRNIKFEFFENSDQAKTFFELGDGHALSQAKIDDYKFFSALSTNRVYSASLIKRSRVIYLNLRDKESPLYDLKFRQALSSAINRGPIIAGFVGEKGTESTGPIHEASWAYDKNARRYRNNPAEAKKLLDDAGWKLADGAQFRTKGDQQAKFELTYFDTPTIKRLAEELASQWELVGVKAILRPQTYEQLSQETVQTREFEAMLYEIETTIDPDSYNFWHSNNVPNPGLNISGYIYDRIDILTERARVTLDRNSRKEDYSLLQRYLLRDVPMIYLYHPSYYFVTHESVVGPNLENITVPSERFWNVQDWYVK